MEEEREEQAEEKKKRRLLLLLLLLLLLIIIGLCIYIFLSARNKKQDTADTIAIEENQGEYVKPEEPIDRSKNVTLPGWGGFTIPAKTKEITEGFEFHNPAENLWYEDQISIDGKELEKLVVDSGNKTALDHYLSLAGIDGSVAKVSSYDKKYFSISQSEDGAYQLEAIAGFEGDQTISLKTDQGEDVELTVSCSQDYYYMTFALYLSEDDELLYQSDLVSPGKYIQKMELTRALKAGSYDVYVVCQPYRSDGKTQTNQGIVNLILTVK